MPGLCAVSEHLWRITATTLQVRISLQLNTILFQKTLVRKDIASSAAESPKADGDDGSSGDDEDDDDDDEDVSSKAQVMTLMTTDVDRIAEFAYSLFSVIDAPLEIVIGTLFLYNLLGVSCFFGLAVACLLLPLNHFAGKVVVGAEESLMKARDERVGLMNEILGGIRMLKVRSAKFLERVGEGFLLNALQFMAWERSFEKRVLKIRERELKYQKLNYTIEVLFNAIWCVRAPPTCRTSR